MKHTIPLAPLLALTGSPAFAQANPDLPSTNEKGDTIIVTGSRSGEGTPISQLGASATVPDPKWIAGVMRHGYKGAIEITASIDYLCAFAATTDAVRDHHFDAVHAAFIEDEVVRAFMAEANPAALRETAARLAEAIDRDLWKPRSNSAGAQLAELAGA